MSFGNIPPLGSIAAVRPVYLIVMGVFLMVIAWRLAKTTEGWTARLLVAGALLLGFGYTILMPMYEAGRIEPFSRTGHYHGSPATALAWHAVKLVIMNSGWLLFGIGLALHAKVFTSPTPRRNPALPPAATHEFIT
jgi:hypothetical protein